MLCSLPASHACPTAASVASGWRLQRLRQSLTDTHARGRGRTCVHTCMHSLMHTCFPTTLTRSLTHSLTHSLTSSHVRTAALITLCCAPRGHGAQRFPTVRGCGALATKCCHRVTRGFCGVAATTTRRTRLPGTSKWRSRRRASEGGGSRGLGRAPRRQTHLRWSSAKAPFPSPDHPKTRRKWNPGAAPFFGGAHQPVHDFPRNSTCTFVQANVAVCYHGAILQYCHMAIPKTYAWSIQYQIGMYQ